MQYTKKQLLKKLAELYGSDNEDNLFKYCNGFWCYRYDPSNPTDSVSLGRTINQAYRFVELLIRAKNGDKSIELLKESVNAKNGV